MIERALRASALLLLLLPAALARSIAAVTLTRPTKREDTALSSGLCVALPSYSGSRSSKAVLTRAVVAHEQFVRPTEVLEPHRTIFRLEHMNEPAQRRSTHIVGLWLTTSVSP